jgi:heme-degrading monooxygenase HmoA
VSARVLIFYRAPASDPEAVERAYHDISPQMKGTPGLRRNELLRDVTEPDRYVVCSEWESLEAFQAWESGPDHRGRTSPLRPFQDRDGDRRHYGIYQVAAAYE